MERFDISAEFRRRVTSRGENQNGYDISSGKAEGRVFHAINLTLHFSLVLLHHFATFKSPPLSLSRVSAFPASPPLLPARVPSRDSVLLELCK